jgi:hypothetical protein
MFTDPALMAYKYSSYYFATYYLFARNIKRINHMANVEEENLPQSYTVLNSTSYVTEPTKL